MFERVREFHRVFGHPVADSPALPSQTVRDLRVRLLKEELDEFCTAHATNHRIEMADGLADICVIIAGTMVAYGIVPGDGKFESPYPDGAKAFLNEKHHHTFTPILCKSFASYEIAERDNDLENINHTLMIMLTDVCGIAVNLGIPLNAVFTEVHRSNLSKLMPDGTVLRREDNKILKGPNYSPPDVASILAEYS